MKLFKKNKILKRTLDILLKRQWLETPNGNKENSSDIKKNQKIKQKLIKSTKINREESTKSIKNKKKIKKRINEIKKKVRRKPQKKEQEGKKEWKIH